MKKLALAFLPFLVCSCALLAPRSAAPANPGAMAMTKFGKLLKNQSFSATAFVTVTSKADNKTTPPIKMIMTMSNGKTRTEMDLSEMFKDANNQGAAAPGMKRMITITRPDSKVAYQLMPEAKAYCEIAITEVEDQPTTTGKPPKIDRKVLGTETVETYKCEKVQNTVTLEDGTTQIVYTWEAQQLKGMPVKMMSETPDGSMTMILKDISTKTPDKSLFELPAGYEKYSSMTTMMMFNMLKQ